MPLKDDSIMPIGKWKGKRMDEVPASWYIWFNKSVPRDRFNRDIHEYIDDFTVEEFQKEMQRERSKP